MNEHELTPYRFWKEIDLSALLYNFKEWKKALPANIVNHIGVVKADAYGHGALQVAEVLVKNGAHAIAVANVGEALELVHSNNADLKSTPILIFGDPLPGEESRFADFLQLQATVSSSITLKRLEQAAQAKGVKISCQMKVDTGMNRQGVPHEKAMELFQEITQSKHLILKGIFTHFSAVTSNLEYTMAQRKAFDQFLQTIPTDQLQSLQIHSDSSPASLQNIENGYINTARIGTILYGKSPDASWLKPITLKPVMSFHARIFLIKEVPQGALVGYGATHCVKRDSRLAMVSVGYAHGLPRTFKDGYALIGGKKCPILNPLSMDQCILDVTDLDEIPSAGDKVTFLGNQGEEAISINDFSKMTFGHSLETFCRLQGIKIYPNL